MKNIAIITARGGSKRIPRKNIREFCGKPIMVYSIEAALKSKLFDEVMVSTDDEEIAAIAKEYGAKVPFMRSEKNSNDYATTSDVLSEVIAEYKKIGKVFEWICCIYPTAPFIVADKLHKAYKKVKMENADALISVVKFSYPPQRCFVVKNESLVYKWPKNMQKRSQDLEEYYHDAGQFYFIKTEVFLYEKTLVPRNTIPFIFETMEVQDIDEKNDWHIAEMKYKIMLKG